MKSPGQSIFYVKKITALLGEKKDPCVSFRVIIRQKVPCGSSEVWCLRERGWPRGRVGRPTCLWSPYWSKEGVKSNKLRKGYFLEIIRLIFGGIRKFVILIYPDLVNKFKWRTRISLNHRDWTKAQITQEWVNEALETVNKATLME